MSKATLNEKKNLYQKKNARKNTGKVSSGRLRELDVSGTIIHCNVGYLNKF